MHLGTQLDTLIRASELSCHHSPVEGFDFLQLLESVFTIEELVRAGLEIEGPSLDEVYVAHDARFELVLVD